MEQHEVLYNLRTDKNLSLRELSELTGISKSMLGHLETGQRTGTIEVLSKLADFYDCSLDYITRDDERKQLIHEFLQELKREGIDILDPKVQKRILEEFD